MGYLEYYAAICHMRAGTDAMAQPQAQWKINIVGHDVKPASWFLGNEKNVKIHPHAQSAITEGSLNELGWLRPVIVNKRTAEVWGRDRGVETLLDGHDRIKLALRRDEATPVPLDYVDLTPEEEDLALLILDEMTGMAVKDKEKLSQLMYTTKPSDAALVQALADMATREGLVAPDVTFKEYDESVEDEVEWLECPECHHRWPK